MPKKFLSPKLIKFSAALIVCLALIILNPKEIFNPIQKFFLTAAYPFQKSFYLMGNSISGTAGFIASISDLKRENEKLIKENLQMSGEIAALKDEKNENAVLRKQLELLPREKFAITTGFVIAQNPQKLGSWVMIDKGTASGIEMGMPAITDGGILIGKTSEVLSGTTRIILLSDSESAVNAIDLETGAKGILKGEYGLGIIMDMISQSETLNAGDSIITSGLDGNMPRGLLVGKIQEIRMSEDKLFQQAIVMPAVKYSKLNVISIIKKPKN